MSSLRNVSPGGALLRSSRLFSLPPPLPTPVPEGNNRTSDTATTPYPTHQVITTTNASRRKGDWGLKRPLPLKTTLKTSTPMIRVNQVDSNEHITDFRPAADHGLTLRKFQEMNIPMVVPSKRSGLGLGAPGKSVFEDNIDFTADAASRSSDGVDVRWKFKGPWLAGMSDGQLKKYLAKQVRRRRPEFRLFLKQTLADQLAESASKEAHEAGETPPPLVEAKDITNEQVVHFLRKLREDRPQLYSLVGKFLDLAPIAPPKPVAETQWSTSLLGQSQTVTAISPYAEDGPPISHPSAGLSYLRTASFLENHPYYGPQARHTAIKARVVAPRKSQGSHGPKLGVGGFVTDVPGGFSTFNLHKTRPDTRAQIPGIEQLDPKIEGGAKHHVAPVSATVNAKGRTILKVIDVDKETELLAKEMAGEEAIHEVPRQAGEAAENRRSGYRRENQGTVSLFGSSATYGLGNLGRRREDTFKPQ